MLERRKVLLIRCDVSSLVIDTLCKEAVEGNAGVACFYFDFTSQEEQSPAAILSSVLKQVVGGLDEVPERIVKAFRDRGKVIGAQRLRLTEIVDFLQDISSSRCTFICTAVFKDKSTEIKKSTWQRLRPVNPPSLCKVNYRFQGLK